MNKIKNSMSMSDPVTAWVTENSKPKEVFLTDWATLHAVQFAGRPIYFGWPYYAWSAGYDTDLRYKIWNEIYSSNNGKELTRLVHEAGINFILIDDAVRESTEFKVNEMLISQTFRLVFSSEKDHTLIFKVD
jgi:hypothetical protein